MTVKNGRLPGHLLAPVHATKNGAPATILLRRDAAASLSRLISLARAEGYGVNVTSGYRDFATQVKLRKLWCSRGKCGYAARPGTSNHGLGVAVDMSTERGGLGQFAHKRPELWAKHGWIWPKWARPPGVHEPWHWEYHPNLDQHKNLTDSGEHDMIGKGARGLHVEHVQRLVNGVNARSARLGDYPRTKQLKVDGVYGPATIEAARIALQRAEKYTTIKIGTTADPLTSVAQTLLASASSEAGRRLGVQK